jgi:flagellar hook assembly protein FlgD
VLRKFLFTPLVAAVLAAPAPAAAQRTVLMPAITYERDVEFTPHGPVVVNVIRGPRPVGLYALKTVLSNDTILGRERVTAMQRRVSPLATVAGVNGDMFNWNDGHPSGMLVQNGVLVSTPQPERSSLGVQADGSLRVERVRFSGSWRGTGQRRPLQFNRPPGTNGVTLFTAAYGTATPGVGQAVAAVLNPFPPAVPGRELTATVTQLLQVTGRVAIPAGGAVLLARGTGANALAQEAPVGTSARVLLTLTPPAWGQLPEAIGGGPVIVRDGKAVFRANEMFTVDQLVPRHPRTGVGQTADGRILIVAVDGRSGLSVGMTNFELALTMVRLGAVTASALDAGGSTTMAFDGRLLNRPSDPGGERAVADGLFVFYYGAYAAAPSEPVLSPNGDGVADRQRLAYKLVRNSTVTATLVAPDGTTRTLDTGQHGPGTYRFTWPGTDEPEGTWKLSVEAVDDLGRRSTAERTFSLNRTLASLKVLSAARSSVRVGFSLTRSAKVRASVLTSSGAFVRTLADRSAASGNQTLTWNGRDQQGRRVRSGRYVVRVVAQNDVGTVTGTVPVSVRR